MKNIKMTVLGAATFLIALSLNFRHALNDYGVKDNKLHVEVLAQNGNTPGNGGNTPSGGNTPGNGGGSTNSGSNPIKGYFPNPISGGVNSVLCEVKGELTIVGFTVIKGNYSKGKYYNISWTVWACKECTDVNQTCDTSQMGTRIGSGTS